MDTWTKMTAWALGSAAVFTSAHLGDELWSRWDIGETMVTSGAYASAMVAIPVALALLAMAGVVAGRKWGLGLAILIGLYALWPPLTHVMDPHDMTALRWTVEGLAALSGLVVVGAASRELIALRPATRAKPQGQ